MTFRSYLTFACLGVANASAQEAPQTLSPLVVSDRASMPERPRFAAIAETIPAAEISETINAVDSEDALKYFPSIFLRKRNNGDTQAVMGTRVWGVSSSARSLVFADGVPLSALIANNNSLGGPRWGLVSPSEIENIHVLYGPFSAAYAGNSIGAVVEITTRQPNKLEAALSHTEAWQHFQQYGTEGNYRTQQTSAIVGNRVGKLSFWVSANFQDSESQPLSYVTSATFPTGTSGGFAASNKLGAPANIIGSGGLTHNQTTNAKIKVAYDLPAGVRATYTFGLWHNNGSAQAETYLRNAAGQPTFAGINGFATGRFLQNQQHTTHSVVIGTNPKKPWSVTFVGSRYDMDRDEQRLPITVSALNAPTAAFGSAGRLVELTGTGWSSLDLSATSRGNDQHVVSFGVHDDRYHLRNPTFSTADWQSRDSRTGTATSGNGKTHTQAIWAQDVWQLTSKLTATVGARFEEWRGYDGFNVNGSTQVVQPEVADQGISPKATLSLEASPKWRISGSIGQAYRFATAAELYQLVSTGTTFTSPDPNLRPDDVLATELTVERTLEDGRVRLALFQDDVHDGIIAQFRPLMSGSPQLFSYVSNVEHVRARGAELMFEKHNVRTRGLTVSGSVTYLDARTLELSGSATANAPAGAAIGKRLPNIPDWRATILVTYRPDQHWTLTAAARYSGKLFTTFDNSDVNFNTYQGFAPWFVADLRAHYRFDRRWSGAIGVDNLLNREYFLFHPFPQRTLVAELKWEF